MKVMRWKYQLGRHSRCYDVPTRFLLPTQLLEVLSAGSSWLRPPLRNCSWAKEAALPKVTCLPQGHPIVIACTISGYKAQHPCSKWRYLWKALPAPDLCRIIWDSCCNLIPVQFSLCPALLSSLLYMHCSLENTPLSRVCVNCCLKVFSLENCNLRLNSILYGLHSTILLLRGYRKGSTLRWITK